MYTKIRNSVIHALYKYIAKPILFQIEPETTHDLALFIGKVVGSNSVTRAITSLKLNYKNKALEQTVAGIHFKNPIGLAAGFDKNAELIKILPHIGFGYAELGSITAKPCAGNSGKRFWRAPKSKSLLIYYGLKNEGAKILSQRIQKTKCPIPIITSIAKTNNEETVETKAGIDDYVEGYKYFTNIGEMFTINISCPNAFGGEPFTNSKKLDLLLKEIDKIETKKPLFLKISPDLTPKEVDNIIQVVKKHKVTGFICSNLTKNRNNPNLIEKDLPNVGGFSGKVQEDLSTKQISYIYQKTKGKYIIIGCGGIFTAEDAYKKIKAGATLLQLITCMIYEGPQVVSEINRGLVKLIKKDGYTNIAQAIGKGNGI